MVSLGAEDAELAEVQSLTAAANVVFDLQTGLTPCPLPGSATSLATTSP